MNSFEFALIIFLLFLILGFVIQMWFNQSFKAEGLCIFDCHDQFLKGYREAEREQALDNLSPDMDCPATFHVHNGVCMLNQDGLSHGRGDNASRSSTLDCGSNNEFACRSLGVMK